MKTKKLSWKYDKQNKEHFTLETYLYANDGFSIKKLNNEYRLYQGSDFINMFRYKKNAILVAELIAFG